MPKRSNAFQRLILAIHKQLAGHASVTESGMLRDRVSGELREVDVVISAREAGYDLVIGVECCDHARKATVEWVEQKCAKHASLATNKLVLVSRSGFTRPATRKAQLYGAVPLALEQTLAVDWTAVVHRVQRVFIDATDITTMLYPGADARPSDPLAKALHLTQRLSTADKRYSLSVQQLLDTFTQTPSIRAALIAPMPQDSDAGWKATLPLAPGVHTVDANGSRVDLDHVTVVLLAKRRKTPVSLEAGRFGEFEVGFGESASDVGTTQVTILEKLGEEPRAGVLRKRGALSWFASLTDPQPGGPTSELTLALRALLRRPESVL